MRSMCRVEEDVWAAAAYPLSFFVIIVDFYLYLIIHFI
jgi:hypothetical protein